MDKINIMLGILASIATIYSIILARRNKKAVEEKRNAEERLKEAELKLISNGPIGFEGGYEEKKIYDYLADIEVHEMWLSGAALFNCLDNILQDEKLYFHSTTQGFTVKIIITHMDSEIAKQQASERLLHADNSRIQLNLELAYDKVVNFIRRLEKRYETFTYEIYLCKTPLEERIWMINPEDTRFLSFIKEYPYKNDDCDGVYLGGFKFILRNDKAQEAFKFYYDKFNNYIKYSCEKVEIQRLLELKTLYKK